MANRTCDNCDRDDLADPPTGVPHAHNVDRQKRLVRLGLRKRRCVRRNRPLDEVNCPYCLTEFKTGDQVVLCPACRLAHHVECWMENEGCCSYGCRAAPLRTLAPSPTAAPEAAPVPAPQAVRPTGPIVCTCGNPLGADEGYCLVCGRSRREMRRRGRRPATPPRVPHAMIRGTRNAIWICLLLAVATGALVGFFGFDLSDDEAAVAMGLAFVAYCTFLAIAFHHGGVMLTDLRDRPFEYGRGTAAAALGLVLVSPLVILGVACLMHVQFHG